MALAEKQGRNRRVGTGRRAQPVPAAPGSDAGPDPVAERLIANARQDYLDALPIAAAIIVSEGAEAVVDCANDHFRYLVEWDERLGDRRLAQIPLLRSGPLGSRIHGFLRSEEPALQFDTSDGRPIAGRYFTVRLARLRPTSTHQARFLLSMIDRTAQVETEKSLRCEMLRDSLTGLPNRAAFNGQLEQLLGSPGLPDEGYAVLAVDMTRFSRVNECIGATAGDELLITFARRLVSALRQSDVLARTAGDEFAILMKLDRGLADAKRAAERIKAVLALPFRLSDLEIRVDCAIGIALLNGCASGGDEVLRNAQFALKRAKKLGTTQIYEANQAQAVLRRFSVETELRRAIEAEELTLAFQPLVELQTGRVSGFEALARWHTEEWGSVSPTEFIAVAEESGLIVPLGRWAIDAALDTLASWDRQAGRVLPLSMNVNLSAIQVMRDDVPGVVARALGQSGIAGSRLTLELTESCIIQDPARAAGVLRALQAYDVRVAMDDFGTGYTSLADLQRLPIDTLKIDRSFVSDMLDNGDSTAIVRAILSLARALGFETTAEGINTADLAELLAELGCSHGQGFYYAPPLPADEAFAFWETRSA